VARVEPLVLPAAATSAPPKPEPPSSRPSDRHREIDRAGAEGNPDDKDGTHDIEGDDGNNEEDDGHTSMALWDPVLQLLVVLLSVTCFVLVRKIGQVHHDLQELAALVSSEDGSGGPN
jgi:hypothetical protein